MIAQLYTIFSEVAEATDHDFEGNVWQVREAASLDFYGRTQRFNETCIHFHNLFDALGLFHSL